jgi:hypothetical protein
MILPKANTHNRVSMGHLKISIHPKVNMVLHKINMARPKASIHPNLNMVLPNLNMALPNLNMAHHNLNTMVHLNITALHNTSMVRHRANMVLHNLSIMVRHKASTVHPRVSGVRHKGSITMATHLLIKDLVRSMVTLVMAQIKVNFHKAMLVMSTLRSKETPNHSTIKAKLTSRLVKILVMPVHVDRTVMVPGPMASPAADLLSKGNCR